MNKLALNCASIHCFLEMIVLHNKSVLLKPIIEKLRLGRLEKLYRRFDRCWHGEVSWNLFRFYFLHYRSGIREFITKKPEINYVYLD